MKKKVAFYIESMIVGGAEKVLIDLVNHLDPNQFEVWVISMFKKSVYSNYEFQFSEQFNVNINYTFLIDNSNQWKYKAFNFLFNKVNKKWLYSFLVKEKFDVEIAFYEGLPTLFVGHSVQKSQKIAWLHTLQNRLYEKFSEAELQQTFKVYTQFNKIIGVSESVCTSFVNFFPQGDAVCCYNPINEKKILEQAYAEEAKHINKNILSFVAVGRLIEIKGFERLIDVFYKIKNRGYHFQLNIIGDGDLKSALQEKINTLQLNNEVQLLGFKNNPYPYIASANALICSSFQEGLNTAVIEALILNTPVISTDCGGMEEIIENGSNGMICDNSEESLLDAVLKVCENPSLLENFNLFLKNNTFKFSLKETIQEIEKQLI